MPTHAWDLHKVILLTCQLHIPTQGASQHHQAEPNKESKLQAVAHMENENQAVATITKDTTQAVAYMGSATKATLLTGSAMQYFQAAYKGLSH